MDGRDQQRRKKQKLPDHESNSRMPQNDGYAGSTEQLRDLLKKWGDVTGLKGRKPESLDEAEKNKLYEYDMRGGAQAPQPGPRILTTRPLTIKA